MIAGAAAHARRYNKRVPKKTTKKGQQTPKKEQRHGSLGSLNVKCLLERPTTSLGTPITTNVQNGNMSNNNLLKVPSDAPLIEGRKRSGSVPVVKITLAVAWNLKSSYVRGLKITWARLCDVPRSNCRGIIGIMDRVFEKFDSKDKHVREVFYQAAFIDSMADCHGRRHSDNSIATLRDHIHFFVSLISQVVNSLEKPPTEIFEHIDKIGSYHFHHLRQCGFRATMWDKLGVLLVDAIVIQDCVRVFPEACKAWTLMLSALIDRLRSARKNFGFPLSLRGSSHQCLNQTTMILNSVTLSRSVSPMDARRPSSPCASPLRRPNTDSPRLTRNKTIIATKMSTIITKTSQTSIV